MTGRQLRLLLRPLAFACLLGSAACSQEGLPELRRVVFVTLDTTRADRLGCYGYEGAATSNLDRLAAEGVLFEQAVSPVPTTLPSHATMFTGLYPQDHGIRYNIIFRLGAESFTLAEAFQQEGYSTAAFPAAYVVGRRYGIDQGFQTFREPPERPRDPDQPTATSGVDAALAWLGEQQDERSFVWLHFYDPHSPYLPPFPFSDSHRDRRYDGEIAYVDQQFGRLMDWLRADPGWEQTLVVVAGDHGEGLFDHNERLHASLVYETTQRVPLIIRAPGISPDRLEEPVSLADLMPTVLELSGIPVPGGLRGVSLVPALNGAELPRRDLYFETLSGALNYGWQELKGIRSGSWKLIDSRDPELFNLAADPGELENLAPREPERLQDLREVLASIAEPLDGSVKSQNAFDDVLDPETEAFLAGLGYVGGAGGSSAEGAPHPRDLIDMDAELLAAQSAVPARRWDRLENVARYVLTRDPTNKWALKNLAVALIEVGRAVEAQSIAAELVQFFPSEEAGYVTLARAYSAAANPQVALEILERGLEKIPDSNRLNYLKLVASFEAEVGSVCSDVRKAVRANFGFAQLLVLRARCEAREGDLQSAVSTLAKAVEMGYRRSELLTGAEDFAALSSLAEFQQLLDDMEAPEQSEADDGESDELRN